jgi:hypothetical protein
MEKLTFLREPEDEDWGLLAMTGDVCPLMGLKA